MCLHIWSSLVPKEQTSQGWQVHPHPEHRSAEKRTMREHWVSPLLLPNSVNIVQTWPQILWETSNSEELEGCNLAILWKTQILRWETGRAKAELQAPSWESWVIREWTREKQNKTNSFLSCLLRLITQIKTVEHKSNSTIIQWKTYEIDTTVRQNSCIITSMTPRELPAAQRLLLPRQIPSLTPAGLANFTSQWLKAWDHHRTVSPAKVTHESSRTRKKLLPSRSLLKELEQEGNSGDLTRSCFLRHRAANSVVRGLQVR